MNNEFDYLKSRRQNLLGNVRGMVDLEKGHPVGYINTYGKQKQADGSWKYVGKGRKGAGASTTGVAHQPAAKVEEGKVDLNYIKQDIKDIVRTGGIDKNEKVKRMLNIGMNDSKMMEKLTGASLSSILAKMEVKGMNHQDSNLKEEEFKNLMPIVPVAERWNSYKLYLDMIASPDAGTRSLIAYGSGGVGKTYNMQQVMIEKNGLVAFDQDQHVAGSPDYDLVKITGKSTPTAMYKALYEHNGKVIVFDDCDSVLENDDAVNILKGALDTNGDGTISYGTSARMKLADGTDAPKRFKFTGKAVFISNLTAKQMPQPLRSRAMTVDLTMTASETIETMKKIVPHMAFYNNAGEAIYVSPEERTNAMNLIEKYADQIDIGDLNARTLGQVALVNRQANRANARAVEANEPIPYPNWEYAALSMLQ